MNAFSDMFQSWVIQREKIVYWNINWCLPPIKIERYGKFPFPCHPVIGNRQIMILIIGDRAQKY